MFDERKLKSIKRVSQAIAALSIVVFFALIGYSAYKLYSINRETAEATAKLQKVKAEEERLTAEVQSKKDTIADLDKRLEALNDIYGKVAFAPNVDTKVVNEATKKVIDSDPKLARILPRIYIQIKDESQRAKAKQVATALQENGFFIPGIGPFEVVGPKAPDTTVLRFYHKTDEETADVEKIIGVLESGKIKVTSQYLPGYENSNKIRPRHYELWFGSDFSPPRSINIQPKVVLPKTIK